MTQQDWDDPYRRTLLMLLNGDAVQDVTPPAESLLVVLHGGSRDREVHLPEPPWADNYRLLWTSALHRPAWQSSPGGRVGAGPGDLHPGERLGVQARTVTILAAERLTRG